MATNGIKTEKGFVRNHQYKRDNFYYNPRSGAHRFEQHKALKHEKVHKRIGAGKKLWLKQFDDGRNNYCKHFRSKKSIADILYLPNGTWRFGRKSQISQLHHKFFYKFF